VSERSRSAEQMLARQGTGLQREQVIEEVAQDLIYELLGQLLPSGAGKLLGDVADSVLHVDQSEFLTQSGGKSYGNVSTVDTTGDSLRLTFTRTVGGLHSQVQSDVG